MGETQGVEIGNTIANLAEDTKDLWAEHLSGHDDGEEVIWGILHDLRRMRRMRSAGDGGRDTS